MKIRTALILVIILTSLVYAGSLKNSFVWDDAIVIVDNDFIKSWSNFHRIFNKDYLTSALDFDYLGKKDIGSGETRYRPLVTASYFIDYAVWELNPFGFHLTNMFLHIVNGILVFFFAVLITKNRKTALAASLLFVLHPVNSEAVGIVSFREDLLSLLFFISAFILFIKLYSFSDRKRHVAYILSLFLFLLALFSKEMAFTLPIMLILYDYFFISQRHFRWRHAYFGYIAVLLFYAGVRFLLMPNIDGEFTIYPGGSLWTNLLTMCRVFSGYLRWLVLPIGIHPIDPSDTAFISYSFNDPKFLIALAVLAVFFAVFAAAYRKLKEAAFGLAYFFIGLLPVSNLFPIENYMAARYLYLPAAGFCIFLSVTLFNLSILRPIKSSILIIMLVFFSIITMTLNFSWKDNTIFSMTMAENYPNKASSHKTLADLFRNAGLLNKAIGEYKLALELDPFNIDSYNMLAVSCYDKGLIDEAIEIFKKAIDIEPANIISYTNLGVLYTRIGKWDKAREVWETALKISPDNGELQLHLVKLGEIGY